MSTGSDASQALDASAGSDAWPGTSVSSGSAGPGASRSTPGGGASAASRATPGGGASAASRATPGDGAPMPSRATPGDGAPMPSRATFPDRCARGAVGARNRAYTFAELVLESTAVAVGEVEATSPGGLPPVEVVLRRSLPPGLPPRLHVSGTFGRPVGPLQFQVGEDVALFLCAVADGKADLTGAGDTGKWPRTAPNWMFTQAHVRPLPEVEGATELVLRARALPTVEARAELLLAQLLPAGPLGEIAAAQLAAKDDFWDGLPSPHGVDRRVVARLVGGVLLTAPPAPRDPVLTYALLAMAQRLPFSAAVPLLIDRLDDPDPAARDTAFASLQTAAAPYGASTFGYLPQADASTRAPAIQQWRDFWAANQSTAMRRDIPPLLAELDDPHPLRRRAAALMLRLVSQKDTGYDADAQEAVRRRAAQGWIAWWRGVALHLK